MDNHDAREVLIHIQAILNRKGLSPCQVRADIDMLISGELSKGDLICDKAWQQCELKGQTFYPVVHWAPKQPPGRCAIHGGKFIKPESTSSAA